MEFSTRELLALQRVARFDGDDSVLEVLNNSLSFLDWNGNAEHNAAVATDFISQTPGLIDKVNQASEDNERFEIVHASEAFEEESEVDWIVHEAIQANSTSAFYGEPGCKKTWSLMHMAACIASGKDWIGREVKQGNVLWIDEESGRRRYLRRLKMILRGLDIEHDIPLYAVTMQSFNAYSADDIIAIEDIVQKYNIKVVFIDALVDVMLGANENDNSEVHQVCAALRHEIADKYNCSVIIIHHENKSGGYRGASALKGAVDNLARISSQNRDGYIEFNYDKNRDIEEPHFAGFATFINDTYFGLDATDLESSKGRGRPKSQEYVLRYLRDNGASLKVDISNSADVCAPTTATRAIYDLTNEGLCERVDNGEQGAEATYGLTQIGESIAESL